MPELVTIGIPTYNDGAYIREMIVSIIGQTYGSLEIIVMDNASTDATAAIVASFSDPRIRYVRNPVTIPPAANFNRLIRLSRGAYVAVYHSDDVYKPSIVAAQLDYFRRFPEVGAVFAQDYLIDELGRPVGEGVHLPRSFLDRETHDFEDVFFEMLKHNGSFLVCPTFMARREVFEKVGYFDETDNFGNPGTATDTELWLRIARAYKIGIIKDRLILRRQSLSQDSTSTDRVRLTKSNHFLVLEHYLRSYSGTVPVAVSDQYAFNRFFDSLIIAKNLARSGRVPEARAMIVSRFNGRIVLSSFKSVRNAVVALMFCAMFISLAAGVPRVSLWLFRMVNKVKPNVPR